MSTKHLPVLIVGAGPVGLTAAVELLRHGIDFRIIDQKPEPTKTSNALAIHARTMEMLADQGLYESFEQVGNKVDQMRIHNARSKVLAHISTSVLTDTDYPFVLDVPQSQTERLLCEYLAAQGVQVERSTRLTKLNERDDHVALTIEKPNGELEQVEASWLLACDGYKSTVREQLNILYPGHDMEQAFIMADIPLHWDRSIHEMNLFSTKLGVVAVFPMEKSCRIIIEVSSDENYDKKAELTKEVFEQCLRERWNFDFSLGEPLWVSRFYIHERLAERYHEGRIFLVGDAAHVHSPAGGQGMNTGMQDAYNLIWKLAAVIKGQCKPSILESYQAERRPVAKTVLAVSEQQIKFASTRCRFMIMLRNSLIRLLSKFHVVRKKMLSTISAIAYHYRASPLSKDYCRAKLRAGDRVPLVVSSTCFVLLLAEDCRGREAIKTYVNNHASALIEIREIKSSDRLYRTLDLKSKYCLVRPDQYIASYGKIVKHLTAYHKMLREISR